MTTALDRLRQRRSQVSQTYLARQAAIVKLDELRTAQPLTYLGYDCVAGRSRFRSPGGGLINAQSTTNGAIATGSQIHVSLPKFGGARFTGMPQG